MSIKMKPAGKLIFLLLFVGIALGGYKWWRDQHPNQGGVGGAIPESTTVLKISGSNTIGDLLAPALVKAWMENSGYSNVQIVNSSKDERSVIGTKAGKNDRIDILAHGTSTGFESLTANTSDLCMASSPAPKEDHYEEHVIGLDGIAIITSKSGSLQSMSISDLQKAFSGATNTIYRMDDNSGTYKVFKELVMRGSEINSSAKKFSSAKELADAVGSDNGGIGFVSYTYLNGANIKALPVAISSGSSGIIPNALTIQSEKYPLCRRLYMYRQKGGNPIGQDLLKWIESPAGQNIVEYNGFINLSINVNNNDDNPIAMPGDPSAYTSLIKDCKKVSSELRFEFGKQELDSRAVADVNRIINFLGQSENRKKKLILVGFTDNIGDANKNIALSLQRANYVKQILEANGALVGRVLGFGSARPVRSNDNEEDRSNNRRVEIWLSN